MPQARPRGWQLPAVICLSYGILAAGCTTVPSTGDAKPAPPAPAWTTKASPAKPGVQAPVAQAGNAQAEVIQPRTVLSYSITVKNSLHGQSMGQAFVGQDGTAAVGPYGTIHVRGLTVAQATEAVEKVVAGVEQNPAVVRLSVIGPVQQAQALGDWSLPQRAITTSPVPGVDSWNGGSTVPVPETSPMPPTLTAPNQRQAADALGAHNWKQGKPPEEPPNPRPLNPPPDAGKGPIAFDPMYPPVASHPSVPTEEHKVTLPPYRVAPPDILQISALEKLPTQPVFGPHLVRPDGTVSIGAYGAAYVAGLTLDQAKEAIARVIHARLDPTKKSLEDVIKGLSVDVAAYNSNVFYVITDRVGFGEIVVRLPITGNETVLDAISQVNGLPPEAARGHIWVARRSPGDHKEIVLPVDWCGITKKGLTATNYQLLPGDRVYVQASRLITFNFVLGKFLAPIERLFGVTLLASQAVNSISNGSSLR